KQAPLPPGIKPVKVKDIWTKDENFSTSQVLAVAAHAAVIALLTVPVFTHVISTTQANTKVDVTPLDISPYLAKLPAGANKAGGLGPGEGAGTGAGMFGAGVNGVGQPGCIYCPNPDYSDEARKAKYQGRVLLDVIVTADGRVIEPRVLKGPGLGLEEKAISAVKNWRMRPASGPNGKPVACRVNIEVVFCLL